MYYESKSNKVFWIKTIKQKYKNIYMDWWLKLTNLWYDFAETKKCVCLNPISQKFPPALLPKTFGIRLAADYDASEWMGIFFSNLFPLPTLFIIIFYNIQANNNKAKNAYGAPPPLALVATAAVVVVSTGTSWKLASLNSKGLWPPIDLGICTSSMYSCTP